MIRRIRVAGSSMTPTYREGERAWAESLTYRFRAPRVGEVVLVDHPTQPFRMVKRVHAQRGVDAFDLRGDAPESSTDSRTYGSFARAAIRARVLPQRPRES